MQSVLCYNCIVQGNRLTDCSFEDFCQLSFNGETSIRRSPVANSTSDFPEQKSVEGVAGLFASGDALDFLQEALGVEL